MKIIYARADCPVCNGTGYEDKYQMMPDEAQQ